MPRPLTFDRSAAPGDREAREVLARYPRLGGATANVLSLGNAGGFSGASLWRAELAGTSFCLRAWPPSFSQHRLNNIHDYLRAAAEASLSFVPVVFRNSDGASCVEFGNRLWELTSWMPGQANFHDAPSIRRLEAAFTALAQLHHVWSQFPSTASMCPAIQRRLDLIRDWQSFVSSGWQPAAAGGRADPLKPWVERGWRLLQKWMPLLPAKLEPWRHQSFPLQPCLCDIWHDHVLFIEDGVAGLVDYGGIKIDHVAVDLARLLGSMVGDAGEFRCAGLRAYGRIRSLSATEEALVEVLDQAGTVLGVANWLLWLYAKGKSFEDRRAVARRLQDLITRIERWK